MNFLKKKIVQLVITLIFINIQKITILRKIKIIIFIQDMKQTMVNNYNLTGKKTLNYLINMENYLSLIYFLLHQEQVDYMFLYIVNLKQEMMYKDVQLKLLNILEG